jgi:hypothetical protein
VGWENVDLHEDDTSSENPEVAGKADIGGRLCGVEETHVANLTDKLMT